jgi:predicted dehydrogenase
VGTGKRIGVALIGAGFMGGTHARAYKAIPAVFGNDVVDPVITVVAEAREGVAKTSAGRWGAERWTTSWEAALAMDGVDVVDICTPPQLHREIGVAAAEAGKHVYCEKPLGCSVEDTRQLSDSARRGGIKTFVGFNYRWSPLIQHLKQLIDRGELGELRHLRASFYSDWAANDSVAWDWRFDAKQAGAGALTDVGSHTLDMVRFLAGEIGQVVGGAKVLVKERSEPGTSKLHQVDTDDYWAALLVFGSGCVGVVDGSRIATGSKVGFSFEIYGSKGAAKWDFSHMNELQLALEQSEPSGSGFKTIKAGPSHPFQGNFGPAEGLGLGFADTKTIEAYQFLRAVANDEPASPSFEDGLRVAEVLDEIRKSRHLTALV